MPKASKILADAQELFRDKHPNSAIATLSLSSCVRIIELKGIFSRSKQSDYDEAYELAIKLENDPESEFFISSGRAGTQRSPFAPGS